MRGHIECDFFETPHFGPRGLSFGPGFGPAFSTGFGSFGPRFGCGPPGCRFGGPHSSDQTDNDNREDDHTRGHHGFSVHFRGRGYGPRGHGSRGHGHHGSHGRGHHDHHDGPFGFLLHGFGPRGSGPWGRSGPYDRPRRPCCRHNGRSCDRAGADQCWRDRTAGPGTSCRNCEDSSCYRLGRSDSPGPDHCEDCCKTCSKEKRPCCSKNKDNNQSKGPQKVTGEVISGEAEERTGGETGEAGESAPGGGTEAE